MTAAMTPAPVSPPRRVARRTRIVPEDTLVMATRGPLAARHASALTRQSELPAPAKLALAAEGGIELRAEILRGAMLQTEDLAHGALDQAAAWLAGKTVAPPASEADEESISAGLEALPVAWAREAAGADFHIHAIAFGVSSRVVVAVHDGNVRAIVVGAVPAESRVSATALGRFALEANRRLRLARIGVRPTDGSASLTWDAIASPGLPLDRSLPAAVEAVVSAHAATRRALRALCQPAMARRYLETQGIRVEDA